VSSLINGFIAETYIAEAASPNSSIPKTFAYRCCVIGRREIGLVGFTHVAVFPEQNGKLQNI